MAGKLIPIAKPPKEPTREQIETALSFVVTTQIELFTLRLAVARGMWRKNRRLIESKTLPEPYRTLYMEANNGDEPLDQESEKAPTVEQLRKDPELLAVARRLAANWGDVEPAAGRAPRDLMPAKPFLIKPKFVSQSV